MYKFKATIEIIGINPFVQVPEQILHALFDAAGKNKGHIPIHVFIDHKRHKQTLVKYKGMWRLYINTNMLKNSPKRVGEVIEIEVEYDPETRKIDPHPDFLKALEENPQAKQVFERLSSSRQQEIIRYISRLRSEASVAKNIQRAIGFLTGQNRFVGREGAVNGKR